MSFAGGRGGGNFFPRGGGRRFPHPIPSMQFGILPLMRPNVQHAQRNSMGIFQHRVPRPPFRGRFRTPGRGEVVRMGPSKPVESPKKSDEKDKKPSEEEEEKNEIKTENKEETAEPSQKTQQDQPSSSEQVPPKVEPETATKVKEEACDVKLARIELDRYNSELHLDLSQKNLVGQILEGPGFEYMWGGVRGTHGVTKGKVCFEVHLLENMKVDLPNEKNTCVARVGWSTDGSDYQLGEDKLSWGYGGTGKSTVDSKFRQYGKPFGAGDVVTCYIDLENVPRAIFYMLNGEYLGVAFRFTNELDTKAVYPHITIKNMKFAINFGATPPKYTPTNGFTMLQSVPAEDLVTPTPGPSKPEEAEIIMMVGLPGSGKSYWCEKYAQEHKEKKFYILGTNLIIDRMKVLGLGRKRNYHGRWEELINRASKVLNKLFEVAKNSPRNYILDQTNVYFTARRRKMDSFRGYKRIAVVLVNKPDVLEWRTDKQRQVEGKLIPDEAIMEMKKNFTLPEPGPSFNDVWYIEEQLPTAREIVQAYRGDGERFKNQSAPKRSSDDDSKRFESKRPREESSSSNRNDSKSFSKDDDRRNRNHPSDDRRKDDKSIGRSEYSSKDSRPSGSRHDSHDHRREKSSYREEGSKVGRDHRFGRDPRDDRPPRRDRSYGRREDERNPLPSFQNNDSWNPSRNDPPPREVERSERPSARDERFDRLPPPNRNYLEESKPYDGFRDERRLPPRREDRPPFRNDSAPDDRGRPYRTLPGEREEPERRYDSRPAIRPGYEDAQPHRRELPFREYDEERRQTDPRYDDLNARELPPRDRDPYNRDEYPPRNIQPEPYNRRSQGDAYKDDYRERPLLDYDRRPIDPPRDVDSRDEILSRFDRQDLPEPRRDALRRGIDQGDDYFERRDAPPKERYDLYDERKYAGSYDDRLPPSRPTAENLDRYPEHTRRAESDRRFEDDRFDRRPDSAYEARRDNFSRERAADYPIKDEWERKEASSERRGDYQEYERDEVYRQDYNERERSTYPREDYRDSNKYYDSQSSRDFRSDLHTADVPHQRSDNQYHQDAPSRSYPGSEERGNRNENRNENYSYSSNTHHSNDRVSSSYQTQMTTSTANYGHQGHSMTSHNYNRSNDQPPMRQSEYPPPQRERERERYHPPQAPPQQPPQKGDRVGSESYEKQQEDYQKAYSQWYANYAQAYAQLSKQSPR